MSDVCNCDACQEFGSREERDDAAVHAFNRAADDTLARAGATHLQRGNGYGDTWAIENLVTTFTDHVLRLAGVEASPELKRLFVIAALIDVKDSRMLGDWRQDTVDDGINYRAAFASWRDEYRASPPIQIGSRVLVVGPMTGQLREDDVTIGRLGTVVHIDEDGLDVKVDGENHAWWYKPAALQLQLENTPGTVTMTNNGASAY